MSEKINKKTEYLAMRYLDPKIQKVGNGDIQTIELPEGATALMLVFDSIESCRKHFGDDVRIVELDVRPKE